MGCGFRLDNAWLPVLKPPASVIWGERSKSAMVSKSASRLLSAGECESSLLDADSGPGEKLPVVDER